VSSRGRGGGGHATAAGVGFQVSVAVSIVVGMLAETEFEPPWGWSRDITIESVRSETGEDVDDILVSTSGPAKAYVQAKHSVTLSTGATSPFGKAIRDFVRQYLASRDGADGHAPLDPEQDRLVLAVGSDTAGSVRKHLRKLLDRLTNWRTDRSLTEAPANEHETKALVAVLNHVNAGFREQTGVDPDDTDVRALLRMLRITPYAFGADGADERAALHALRTSVVADPERAGDAWNAICQETIDNTAGQSGLDRRAAQLVLQRESIELQAPRSYRDDIAKLGSHTRGVVVVLRELSDIALYDGRIKISRAAPSALQTFLETTSCVLIGDPGAGKSATLYELVHNTVTGGADVVAFAADRLGSASLGGLRIELGLKRDIVEVLANWPTEQGLLVIDALDAARGDRTQDALLDLIAETRRLAPRWRVVASIRRFDLRYNPRLKQIFAGAPLADQAYADAEFAGLAHFNVAELTVNELAQLATDAPTVHAFLQTANDELKRLVLVPFNLRLLAQLLDEQVDLAKLHPIRTQLELLDLYWQHRVLTPSDRADVREALLRRVCELIVKARSMRVNRADVGAEPALVSAIPEMLSAQLLVEGDAGDRSIVGFAHHVLFDYAAANLLLRQAQDSIVDRLAADSHLPVLIRPSISLHMRWLWEHEPEHSAFWDLVSRITANADIPEIATLVGTAIAAEMTETLDDLAPLLAQVASDDAVTRDAGERVLMHVLASVQTLDIPLVGPAAGPWAAVAARLTEL
jgi:hypothetical protein